MLNKIINKINFKDRLFSNEKSEADLEKFKEEVKSKTDDIINQEFNKVIAYIQDSYIDLSDYISKRVDDDLKNMKVFEYEDYANELQKVLETDLKQITKNIIKQLPDIDKKETDIH